eukprot:916105-Alexandrium_andersonii.AAC.1
MEDCHAVDGDGGDAVAMFARLSVGDGCVVKLREPGGVENPGLKAYPEAMVNSAEGENNEQADEVTNEPELEGLQCGMLGEDQLGESVEHGTPDNAARQRLDRPEAGEAMLHEGGGIEHECGDAKHECNGIEHGIE